MTSMGLPGGSGHDGVADGSPDVPGGLAVFTPMVLAGCLGWVRITVPQVNARAACLAVSAHIHLMRPEIPLRDLNARAEAAIRALEGGADSVAVIDDQHRVDRTGPTRRGWGSGGGQWRHG